MRKMIAFGVKKAGGDILAFAKQREAGVSAASAPARDYQPPHGWQLEQIALPSGGRARYLVPPHAARLDAAILQVHGGGYMLGFSTIFQRLTPKLARRGGNVPVLALDYRLAPEHPYPAALNDACEAMDWLAASKGIQPASVLAIGESAGAGLALALAMRLRDEGRGTLRALVLMSPWSDLTGQSESFVTRYPIDPMFGSKTPRPVNSASTPAGHYYAGSHDLRDPYLSPAFGNYAGLPPMLIHVGECEMLLDDAIIVYEKATAAGIPAEIKVWAGMFHAFQLMGRALPEARQAWREIGHFMRHYLGTNS